MSLDDQYDFNDLFPIALITYWIFLLAVLMKVLSLPRPFSFRYNSNASEIFEVSSLITLFSLINVFLNDWFSYTSKLSFVCEVVRVWG